MKTINTRLSKVLSTMLLVFGLTAAVQAQFTLTTTFAAGNNQNGNMFDLRATSVSLVINSFDIHILTGVTATVEVYAVTSGASYVGNETNPASWTLLATTQVVSAGTGVPTPLNLNMGYVIPPGTLQGFYVTANTALIQYTNGTLAGNLFVSDTFLEFFEGLGVAYPFGGNFTSRIFNGNIHYGTLSTLTDDIAVTAVSSPVGQNFSCQPLTNSETVTVELRNWGMNAVPGGTLVNVDYQIDSNPVVSEVILLSNPLNQGQAFLYSFVTLADLSVPGPHTLTVSCTYIGDLDPANDVLVKNIDSGATQITAFPFFESFDGLANPGTIAPAGWGQDPADGSGVGSDWNFTNVSTPTVGAGPSLDNSGAGYFAYVEDDGEQVGTSMRSPCFNLTGLTAPRASFFLYSNNAGVTPANDATFAIDVISLTTGTTTANAFGPIGHIGPSWNYQFLDLLPWFGETIQLVFRVSTNNGSLTHDIGLDDFAVYDPQPTPGQGPQAGLAVMDVNSAKNSNQEPTYVPGNGPYYSTATIGGVLAFTFRGEPNRPIVLLTGPLNPVAATFANVGQFDIGGPIDPMTGIPTSLIILADGGNAQGLNAFFVTSPSGFTDLGFGIPNLPLGVLGTFQAALFTSGINGAPVALTNAVQVTLM